MKNKSLQLALLTSLLCSSQQASAMLGTKDDGDNATISHTLKKTPDVAEAEKLNISYSYRNHPEDSIPLDNKGFLKLLEGLKGKSIAKLDVTGWIGINDYSTLIVAAHLIKELSLAIDEIQISWGHMNMLNAVPFNKPEDNEKSLMRSTGDRTQFKLSFY